MLQYRFSDNVKSFEKSGYVFINGYRGGAVLSHNNFNSYYIIPYTKVKHILYILF